MPGGIEVTELSSTSGVTSMHPRSVMLGGNDLLQMFRMASESGLGFLGARCRRFDDRLPVFVGVYADGEAQAEYQQGVFRQEAHFVMLL